jgi:hypothetical protein
MQMSLKRKALTMDILWNTLGIFCICLSLFMIIFSVHKIVKERKQVRHLLTPGEKMPPWYTNATFRKYSESLVVGVFLTLFLADLAPFLKHVASAFLWEAVIIFLYSCSKFVLTICEEAGQRRMAREAGEELPRLPRNLGIGTAIFWLGASVMILLNGLTAIKAQPLEVVDHFAWLWGSLMLVGGLSWLTVRTLQAFKTYKQQARSSSSSSRFPH